MALAGDLADKNLRNLPAALDPPALTRLPESNATRPFGTTIVPVLIAELTQPDRQGCQRNSVRYQANAYPSIASRSSRDRRRDEAEPTFTAGASRRSVSYRAG